MNDTELWRLIKDEIVKKREDITHAMHRGHYTDLQRYREDVGVLRGFQIIEDTVKNIYQPKIDKEEPEDV